MVDAFFIGRTGNSYMMAATTLALTLITGEALSAVFALWLLHRSIHSSARKSS